MLHFGINLAVESFVTSYFGRFSAMRDASNPPNRSVTDRLSASSITIILVDGRACLAFLALHFFASLTKFARTHCSALP